MTLRFISPTMHGVVDYSAAVGLISMPFLLGLGSSTPMALWLSVITGIAVVVASSMTNYKLGLFRVIPFQGHLAIDLSVATFFMIAPFIFQMSGFDAYYYWANATVVFLVVGLSESKGATLY